MRQAFGLISTALMLSACQPSGSGGSSSANVEKGAALYKQACAACHGIGPGGGFASSLTDNRFEHGATDDAIIQNMLQGIPSVNMPALSDKLSREDAEAVLAYIRHESGQ